MNIEQIDSAEFRDRLAAVYGSSAVNFQKERFTFLAKKFMTDFPAQGEFRFFSAPGRTEIGGNHTDHNNGKVLAAAIDLDAIAAAAKRDDNIVSVASEGHKLVEIDLSQLAMRDSEAGKSAALIRGICFRLKELGYTIGGFDASVTSRVLAGSGLSSSAAYEVLIVTIMSHLYNEGNVDPVTAALVSQYAENVFFGKPCGLMDQTACSVGGFVAIDFKNNKAPAIQKVDYDFSKSGYLLCIINTGGTHADLTDDYAAIRLEMNSVAGFFGKKVLRDVNEADVLANISELRDQTGDRAIERAIHFYNENKRVDRLVEALDAGDFEEFKHNITESGHSSFMYNQNVYSNGKPYEQPVALALCLTEEFLDGCGAYRVHGGGFAGTIQVFVPEDAMMDYIHKMKAVFGEDSCFVLSVRSAGGCEV